MQSSIIISQGYLCNMYIILIQMKNVIDGVVNIIVHACMGKESEHIQNERGRLGLCTIITQSLTVHNCIMKPYDPNS